MVRSEGRLDLDGCRAVSAVLYHVSRALGGVQDEAIGKTA